MDSSKKSYGYVDPGEVRFTQADIRPSLCLRKGLKEEVTIEEAVRRIEKGQRLPLGKLKVYRDKRGVMWSFHNRRLYVLLKAGVTSVKVKFVSEEYIIRSKGSAFKTLLDINAPSFRPQIRPTLPEPISEPAVLSLPSTSVRSSYREQHQLSLLGLLAVIPYNA